MPLALVRELRRRCRTPARLRFPFRLALGQVRHRNALRRWAIQRGACAAHRAPRTRAHYAYRTAEDLRARGPNLSVPVPKRRRSGSPTRGEA